MWLYHHRGSHELNREGSMKYSYEKQLKQLLLILCYVLKGDIQKDNLFRTSAKQQLKPLQQWKGTWATTSPCDGLDL